MLFLVLRRGLQLCEVFPVRHILGYWTSIDHDKLLALVQIELPPIHRAKDSYWTEALLRDLELLFEKNLHQGLQ